MGEPQAILLVEDNPADIYLTQTALAECSSDIRLSVVPNGRDALAFLRKEGPYAQLPSPVLILLDLNLPKLSGGEVLAALRHLAAYQATPVVIFSAARKELEEQHCLQLGANAYVQKPSDFDGFLATVHNIIDNWLTHEGSQ
jgi:chemotaxis family two-component system response regulator Rcp1